VKAVSQPRRKTLASLPPWQPQIFKVLEDVFITNYTLTKHWPKQVIFNWQEIKLQNKIRFLNRPLNNTETESLFMRVTQNVQNIKQKYNWGLHVLCRWKDKEIPLFKTFLTNCNFYFLQRQINALVPVTFELNAINLLLSAEYLN
jgi:hypothetical protein